MMTASERIELLKAEGPNILEDRKPVEHPTMADEGKQVLENTGKQTRVLAGYVYIYPTDEQIDLAVAEVEEKFPKMKQNAKDGLVAEILVRAVLTGCPVHLKNDGPDPGYDFKINDKPYDIKHRDVRRDEDDNMYIYHFDPDMNYYLVCTACRDFHRIWTIGINSGKELLANGGILYRKGDVLTRNGEPWFTATSDLLVIKLSMITGGRCNNGYLTNLIEAGR